MSFFEAGMLLCFGASWPFSVYKTWKAKTSKGKSLIFLWLILIGYACGITHKLLYSRDLVIALYLLNATLVLVDLSLCTIYSRREKIKHDLES
ncbi:MAG: hypothetical protein WCO42_01770 [bacterium]